MSCSRPRRTYSASHSTKSLSICDYRLVSIGWFCFRPRLDGGSLTCHFCADVPKFIAPLGDDAGHIGGTRWVVSMETERWRKWVSASSDVWCCDAAVCRDRWTKCRWTGWQRSLAMQAGRISQRMELQNKQTNLFLHLSYLTFSFINCYLWAIKVYKYTTHLRTFTLHRIVMPSSIV